MAGWLQDDGDSWRHQDASTKASDLRSQIPVGKGGGKGPFGTERIGCRDMFA